MGVREGREVVSQPCAGRVPVGHQRTSATGDRAGHRIIPRQRGGASVAEIIFAKRHPKSSRHTSGAIRPLPPNKYRLGATPDVTSWWSVEEGWLREWIPEDVDSAATRPFPDRAAAVRFLSEGILVH